MRSKNLILSAKSPGPGIRIAEYDFASRRESRSKDRGAPHPSAFFPGFQPGEECLAASGENPEVTTSIKRKILSEKIGVPGNPGGSTDTIVAIATAVGESGIGIVRISGPGAVAVADKIFRSKGAKKPSSFKTYTTHYGWIIDLSKTAGGPRANVIDEVILTVMRAPKSYTREDVVEINCHGGILALRRVLDSVLENGCRLAEPGEFTKRAFLNGRIDLAQAEAVIDIIRAKTDTALKIGVNQLKGALSAKIDRIRDALMGILSILDANIDFPDEEISISDSDSLSARLRDVRKELRSILESSRRGRVFREGVHAVICGKPNVGKSSLLNALLKSERSIVTPVAGTTRDTIEEIIDVKGIPVRIVDTAGIIEPRDLVEKKAVIRSREQMDIADLVILVFDGSKKPTKQDYSLIRKLSSKKVLAVINKMDIGRAKYTEKIVQLYKDAIFISAKRMNNIDLLEQRLAELVYGGKIDTGGSILAANMRHIEAIKHAEKLVAQSLVSLDNKLSLEFIAQDIKEALVFLDAISGRKFSEDLLDRIFRDFCIGK